MVVDTLEVVLKADASDYAKSVKDMVDGIKSATDKTVADHKRMIESAKAVSDETIKSYEGMAQSAMKSAQVAGTAIDTHISKLKELKAAQDAAAQVKLASATAAYHASAPGNPLAAEFAAAKAGIDTLRATSQQAAVATEAAAANEKLHTSIGMVGKGLELAAPILGIVNADLGLASIGIARVSEVCPQAAAGLAVFGASIYATSYALGGAEAANNSFSNTLELSKMLLSGVTFGYADYTEATKLAKEGTAALNSQMASGAAMVQEYRTKREALIGTLHQEVQALHDVSDAAEAKYVAHYRGSLGQLGIRGPQLDQEEAKAHGEFQQRRVDDFITSKKSKIDAIGQTAADKEKELLDTLNLTKAQREQVDALNKLQATKEAAIEASKKEAKAQEDSARAAKHAADESKRQQEHLEQARKSAGQHLHESLMTDAEKISEETKKAKELLDASAITKEDFDRYVAKINEPKKEKAEHASRGHSGLIKPVVWDSPEFVQMMEHLQPGKSREQMKSEYAAKHYGIKSTSDVVGDIPKPYGRTIRMPSSGVVAPVAMTQAEIDAAAEMPYAKPRMSGPSYAADRSKTTDENTKVTTANTTAIEKQTAALEKITSVTLLPAGFA